MFREILFDVQNIYKFINTLKVFFQKREPTKELVASIHRISWQIITVKQA